jgi:hypothetical protein
MLALFVGLINNIKYKLSSSLTIFKQKQKSNTFTFGYSNYWIAFWLIIYE